MLPLNLAILHQCNVPPKVHQPGCDHVGHNHTRLDKFCLSPSRSQWAAAAIRLYSDRGGAERPPWAMANKKVFPCNCGTVKGEFPIFSPLILTAEQRKTTALRVALDSLAHYLL